MGLESLFILLNNNNNKQKNSRPKRYKYKNRGKQKNIFITLIQAKILSTIKSPNYKK